ncbi:N-acetylmuramoyl-L-alanine amidase AmiA precursor [bacterium BMS3Abin07]|nr:N-acetylmuramoyl-L-alanine amidase AmiA precursor [bacterium BMS3Abin07]GBE32957.1 N-acetylmuramoyl-L-alanine amidase AmiA precursor [bacterium BMS3Bbin05]
MKRLVILAVLIVFCSSMAYGDAYRVSMRWSAKPGYLRLVLESGEEIIKTARVYHSYSLVKVEFQSEFSFDYENTPDAVDISHKGSSLFININGLKDVKVFRLADPSRLVIDAEIEKTANAKTVPEEPVKPYGLSDVVMVIDPGHGGYSMGLVGSDYKEKDIVLSIARSLRYTAGQAGAKVFLTRSTDKYVSIDERINSTYKKKPDVFISLHMSSSPDFVVYYAKMDTSIRSKDRYMLKYSQLGHLGDSVKLSRVMAEVLREKFKRKVRIISMPLPLLSSIGSAAITIELPDGKYFDYNASNRYALVNTILKGIGKYER